MELKFRENRKEGAAEEFRTLAAEDKGQSLRPAFIGGVRES